MTVEYYADREHRCELLVRIIQSREGNPSKAEREEAFEELLDMFRPLMKSVTRRVYRAYGHALRTDFPSFYHDTVTTAIELILTDYIPKKFGGKAMFTPYLQSKLFFRTLYRAQKTCKLNDREVLYRHEHDEQTDTAEEYGEFSEGSDSSIIGDINKALLAQAVGSFDSVHECFTQNEISRRLANLKSVAERRISSDDFYIWHSTLFSEMQMQEIAAGLNARLPVGAPPWTKQRVYNAYHKIRTVVLAAYGQESLAGEF